MKLSIGEFAKLKNITTETLRHYDRINLLKPTHIDKNTGYRYYSILQHEKLSTIKELRELDMSLEDIKTYFENKNLGNSIMMLERRNIKLKRKIKKLDILQKNISSKLNHLKQFESDIKFDELILKEFSDRYMITLGNTVSANISEYYNMCTVSKIEHIFAKNSNDINNMLKNINVDEFIEESYNFTILENMLPDTSPLIGVNKIGIISKLESVNEIISFILVDKNTVKNSEYTRIIAGGKYLCVLKKSIFNISEDDLKNIVCDIENKGYKPRGDVIQIIQTDLNVTNIIDEIILEIQIPLI